MTYVKYIDSLQWDVSHGNCPPLIINNYSGSYPAFEEMYKWIMNLGVDLEALRRENLTVDEGREKIKAELTKKYSAELGEEFLVKLEEYIYFFDSSGFVFLEEVEGVNAVEAREEVIRVYNECMAMSE